MKNTLFEGLSFTSARIRIAVAGILIVTSMAVAMATFDRAQAVTLPELVELFIALEIIDSENHAYVARKLATEQCLTTNAQLRQSLYLMYLLDLLDAEMVGAAISLVKGENDIEATLSHDGFLSLAVAQDVITRVQADELRNWIAQNPSLEEGPIERVIEIGASSEAISADQKSEALILAAEYAPYFESLSVTDLAEFVIIAGFVTEGSEEKVRAIAANSDCSDAPTLAELVELYILLEVISPEHAAQARKVIGDASDAHMEGEVEVYGTAYGATHILQTEGVVAEFLGSTVKTFEKRDHVKGEDRYVAEISFDLALTALSKDFFVSADPDESIRLFVEHGTCRITEGYDVKASLVSSATLGNGVYRIQGFQTRLFNYTVELEVDKTGIYRVGLDSVAFGHVAEEPTSLTHAVLRESADDFMSPSFILFGDGETDPTCAEPIAQDTDASADVTDPSQLNIYLSPNSASPSLILVHPGNIVSDIEIATFEVYSQHAVEVLAMPIRLTLGTAAFDDVIDAVRLRVGSSIFTDPLILPTDDGAITLFTFAPGEFVETTEVGPTTVGVIVDLKPQAGNYDQKETLQASITEVERDAVDARYQVTSVTTKLAQIEVDGASVPGFQSDALNMSIELPAGTTAVPQITGAVPVSEHATTTIVQADSLEDAATITVRATTPYESSSETVYTITFSVAEAPTETATETPKPKVRSSGGGGRTIGSSVSRRNAAANETEATEQDSAVSSSTATVVLVESSVNPSVLGASSARFTHDLRLGMRSDLVRELQARLRREGFFTYPEDTSYFGHVTLSAVRAYQRQHGLPATGYVGPMTRERLNQNMSATNEMDLSVLIALLVALELIAPEKVEAAYAAAANL